MKTIGTTFRFSPPTGPLYVITSIRRRVARHAGTAQGGELTVYYRRVGASAREVAGMPAAQYDALVASGRITL